MGKGVLRFQRHIPSRNWPKFLSGMCILIVARIFPVSYCWRALASQHTICTRFAWMIDSGHAQFGFFITWSHKQCAIHICFTLYILLFVRNFEQLKDYAFLLLPCFFSPGEVFIKVTITSVINLENYRSFGCMFLRNCPPTPPQT